MRASFTWMLLTLNSLLMLHTRWCCLQCDEDVTSIAFLVPNDHDRIKGLYRRYVSSFARACVVAQHTRLQLGRALTARTYPCTGTRTPRTLHARCAASLGFEP